MMSDFPARAFKWTEILSLIIERLKGAKLDHRNLFEDINQLRQYATQKYKANPEIEDRFTEYISEQMEMFAILVQMFGKP